jgi:hypothetical protein
MHLHFTVSRGPGARLAGVGQRLTGRAKSVTTPCWPARHPRQLCANWLNPGRAPEESYRDYMFRKSIWP